MVIGQVLAAKRALPICELSEMIDRRARREAIKHSRIRCVFVELLCY